MVVSLVERDRQSGMPLDENGIEIDPNVYETVTDFGFIEGWAGFANVYYLGEWHYDSNGNPVPNK